MSRSLLLAALAGLAFGVPYPPEVAEVPPAPTTEPFFQGLVGNHQPSTGSSNSSFEVFAKGGVVSGGAAVAKINNKDGVGAGNDKYKTYKGDGSVGAGWPSKDKWVSFDAMFAANKAVMFHACGWNKWGADDSPAEVGNIHDAIQDAARKTKVDHRFILAVVLQESGGCVRVPTSNYGVRNPGLMQSHNGDGTCHSDKTGKIQNPCPKSEIFKMVSDGAAGTKDGDGLAQTINQATKQFGVTNSRAFYIAARLFNSGEVAPNKKLEAGIATHCYSSDIANRLTGWVLAKHTCPFDN